MSDASASTIDFDYPLGALEVTACEFVVTTPQSRDPLADETVRKVLTLLKEQHGADAAFVCELRDETSTQRASAAVPRNGFHDEATGDVYVLAVCQQIFGHVARCFMRVPVVLADGRGYGTLYAPCKPGTDDERKRYAALIEMTAQLTARLVDARRSPKRAEPASAQEQAAIRQYA